MSKIALNVIGISSSQTQSGGYALILSEQDGLRRLPIIIGVYEAQSIAIFIERMRPPRPLTHDLFKTFALAHQIIVKEVIISKFQEGVFYAEIHSLDAQGNVVVTDARSSDAVALAIRFDCPIYTTEDVLTQTGIRMDIDPEEEPEEESDNIGAEILGSAGADLRSRSLEDLDAMLAEAVSSEHYELASQIRDEINRRKSADDV
jgi:uncharacterized protein